MLGGRWEAGEGELQLPQFLPRVADDGVAWALLPLSSSSPGGFTEETKRKVLDTLGFQSMQLEQSTWCVAQPGCGRGWPQCCCPGSVQKGCTGGERGVGCTNAPVLDPPGARVDALQPRKVLGFTQPGAPVWQVHPPCWGLTSSSLSPARAGERSPAQRSTTWSSRLMAT